MSDEPTAGHAAAPAAAATPEAPTDAYGQPISAERQAELQGHLDHWQAEIDHGDRKGPFDNGDKPRNEQLRLSGADVSWLAEQSGRDDSYVPNLHLEGASLRKAHLEGANLSIANLEGANLRLAHLEGAFILANLKGAFIRDANLDGANLHEAHLERANLRDANLKGANLTLTHLEGANLGASRLNGAVLGAAHLEGANLTLARLEGADFREANLKGANLTLTHLEGAILAAHLERAILRHAHLEGADLRYAHLEGADLTAGFLDGKTLLADAVLDAETRLGDLQWGGVGAVNLTQIDWRAIPRLGDERGVGVHSEVRDHEHAARAYRQLAAQLRAQGLSEVADRFFDRAQVRQRKLLFRQMLADWRRPWRLPGDLARWLFSWFLALLAGYGYHPGRSVFWYLATIAGFSFMYMQATRGWIPFGLPHPSQLAALPWYEALILSVSSFHGRGFFQPLQSLGDPVAALASIEAVIGLLIEISFIATFTQRFFGSR